MNKMRRQNLICHPTLRRPIEAAKKCGYSLVELSITIAIASALTSVAIPGLASFIDRAQFKADISALQNSLAQARYTALSKRATVHLCQRDSNEEKCGNYNSYRNWMRGWLLFIDYNNNNELDAQDELINSLTLDGSNTILFNQRGRLRFFPDGSSRSAGFILCNRTGTEFRRIYLLFSGRARSTDTLSQHDQNRCVQERS